LGWRSARRMASIYTGQHNTEKSGHTSMPRVGFEPTITVFERPKTLIASVRSATGTVDWFRNRTECTMFHLLPNVTQMLMLIHCYRNRSLIFGRDVETHTSYQRHNFHTNGVHALKLVQVETCKDMSPLRSSHMAPFKPRQ
jgi:hypothetical protein